MNHLVQFNAKMQKKKENNIHCANGEKFGEHLNKLCRHNFSKMCKCSIITYYYYSSVIFIFSSGAFSFSFLFSRIQFYNNEWWLTTSSNRTLYDSLISEQHTHYIRTQKSDAVFERAKHTHTHTDAECGCGFGALFIGQWFFFYANLVAIFFFDWLMWI